MRFLVQFNFSQVPSFFSTSKACELKFWCVICTLFAYLLGACVISNSFYIYSYSYSYSLKNGIHWDWDQSKRMKMLPECRKKTSYQKVFVKHSTKPHQNWIQFKLKSFRTKIIFVSFSSIFISSDGSSYSDGVLGEICTHFF